MKKSEFIKFLTIVLAAVIFFTFSTDVSKVGKKMWLHFIDVGYGDAIFLEFSDEVHALVDAGAQEQGPVVLKYLRAQGVEKLNFVIITHPHPDHFGGFFHIIEQMPIDYVFMNGEYEGPKDYTRLLKLVKEKGIPIFELSDTNTISNIPIFTKLEVLNPKELTSDYNANSVALRLTYGRTQFLLSSDVTPEVQDQILVGIRNQRLGEIDYVQIPHHGGPISDNFIRKFKEKTYIVSVGENKWGFPKAEDIKRLKQLKGNIYRTDVDGTIVLETDGQKVVIKTDAIKN